MRTSTSLCCAARRRSRAAFYLHFDGLSAVVDELLEETLGAAERTGTFSKGDPFELWGWLREQDDPKLVEQYYHTLPICLRVADDSKYQPLFMDDLLSSVVTRKVYLAKKDRMVPLGQEYCGISREQSKILFQYAIQGSYTVNRALRFQRTEEWYHMVCVLLTYIMGGNRALRWRAAGACMSSAVTTAPTRRSSSDSKSRV